MKYRLSNKEIDTIIAKILGKTKTIKNFSIESGLTERFESVDFSFSPTKKWDDCGPIIDMFWDELTAPFNLNEWAKVGSVSTLSRVEKYTTKWSMIMEQAECTSLEAACIFFIQKHELK